MNKISLGQTISFITSGNENETHTAKITAINPSIDDQSRNLDIRAQIVNDGKTTYLPGMYVEASIITDDISKVVVVPTVAVNYSLYGDTVYVIDQKSKRGAIHDPLKSWDEIINGRGLKISNIS